MNPAFLRVPQGPFVVPVGCGNPVAGLRYAQAWLSADVNGSIVVTSAELAGLIRSADYTHASATVVGYGNMGRAFVGALRDLGVGRIHVCSRFEKVPDPAGLPGVVTTPGGYGALDETAACRDLAIVATPIGVLAAAARHLAHLGFRNVLIEKPVSLRAREIEALAAEMEAAGVAAFVGYNRVAYPAFHEARARAAEDGGITSCVYTFTEFVDRIGPEHFGSEELARWGVANSLHVMSMAHGFIGLPESWTGYRGRGRAVPWHPAGAVFVGAGVSTADIPFAYQADWGSRGRWSVEINTAKASYRLCPIESLLRKTEATGDWAPVALTAAAPAIKTGFVEQVAAMLHPEVRRAVPLVTLREAARLTHFAEDLFGYEG
jgi:predicted dehydrogenase